MSSSSEEDFKQEVNKILVENLLPPKSGNRYEKGYEDFIKWKTGKGMHSFSETVLLAYFHELSKNKRPSTLWCVYSMLKTTIRLKENVNIGDYVNLLKFLKRMSKGFIPTKSKAFSVNNIETFLKEAPDEQYLLDKVVLIFGVNGGCRSHELTTITINDVETYNDKMLVRLSCTKTKKDRMFIVQDEQQLKVIQDYQNLRPDGIKNDRFFFSFKNGKCTNQVVGRHKIAETPKRIATYLNLPDPESYTGHCFKRSSAILLADKGVKTTTLKKQFGWVSNEVSEGYIEESLKKNSKVTIEINKDTIKAEPLDPLSSTSSWVSNEVSEGYIEESLKKNSKVTIEINKDTIKAEPLDPLSSTSSAEPSDEFPTEDSTSSTPNSNERVHQINIPGKNIKLSFSNCTNCKITFNMK